MRGVAVEVKPQTTLVKVGETKKRLQFFMVVGMGYVTTAVTFMETPSGLMMYPNKDVGDMEFTFL